MESPSENTLNRTGSSVICGQSYAQQDTKCSSNQSEMRITTQCTDSLIQSFGSTSEGSSSMLAKPMPISQTTIASHLPSQQSYPPLIKAVISNSAQTCQELLDTPIDGELSTDVNIKGPNQMTPLHIAAQLGYLKVAQVLLDYGEEIDINPRNKDLRTPLHQSCLQNHFQLAQLLVRSGAMLNALDFNYETPLHLLARGGNLEFLSWFLSKNPDLYILNLQGATAVDISSSQQVYNLFEDYCQRKGVSMPVTGKKREINYREPKRVTIREIVVSEQSKTANPMDFEPIQKIGRGSFGEVYLVKKDSEFFAMKVLRKDKIMRQNLIKYALTERNVLSYIRHPFIVGLNCAFQTDEKLFLILDYAAGGDLATVLACQKRFDERTAKMYISQVVLAIQELHRRDIIFRDLKPDNIVIDSNGHAMLTDFGLSKEGVIDNCMATSFCGSLAYLAPEMIKRKGHGKAVDWYLLGVLLYQMLVGIPPYFSNNKEELFANIQKGKLKVPACFSVQVKDLLRSLLQRDPLRRMGSKMDAEQVKSHTFFRDVNWHRVLARKQQMPAPQIKAVGKVGIHPQSIFGSLNSSVSASNKISGWSFTAQSVFLNWICFFLKGFSLKQLGRILNISGFFD